MFGLTRPASHGTLELGGTLLGVPFTQLMVRTCSYARACQYVLRKVNYRSSAPWRHAPPQAQPECSLYKIVLHFKALGWEFASFDPLPPPTCKAYPVAILLHNHCTIYAPPPTPPLYAIHHTPLVMTTSCKGPTLVSPHGTHTHTHDAHSLLQQYTLRMYLSIYT